jgi:hypothetical protein
MSVAMLNFRWQRVDDTWEQVLQTPSRRQGIAGETGYQNDSRSGSTVDPHLIPLDTLSPCPSPIHLWCFPNPPFQSTENELDERSDRSTNASRTPTPLPDDDGLDAEVAGATTTLSITPVPET